MLLLYKLMLSLLPALLRFFMLVLKQYYFIFLHTWKVALKSIPLSFCLPLSFNTDALMVVISPPQHSTISQDT